MFPTHFDELLALCHEMGAHAGILPTALRALALNDTKSAQLEVLPPADVAEAVAAMKATNALLDRIARRVAGYLDCDIVSVSVPTTKAPTSGA